MLLVVFFSIPYVQSELAKIATNKINEEFETNIVVKKLDLSFLGNVNLKAVEIRDHHNDTLIFVKSLKTSLRNVKKVIDNEIDLGDVTLNGVDFYMKKYKGEKDDNLAIFIKTFDDEKDSIKSKLPFILKTKNIYLDDLNFKLYDFDSKDPLKYAAFDTGGHVQDFSVEGPNVFANVRGLFLKDNRGLNFTNFTANFSYTKKQMLFKELIINTETGSVLKGNLAFNYRRQDLPYFTDKVKLNAQFYESVLSVSDLQKFYQEIKGNDKMFFSGDFYGTLNNLNTPNLKLRSKNGLIIHGDMGFVNTFNTNRGFIFEADLEQVSSNYNQLKKILPNIFGNKMPTSFSRLGKFGFSGLLKLTPEMVDATLYMTSELGSIYSDIQLINIENINEASYSGEIEFVDFDLGEITSDESLGQVSLKVDVDGSGFRLNNVNSVIVGKIAKFDYNKYSYQNLIVNGEFQNRKFDGYLKSNDESFDFEFTGLADFSNEINKFDFSADIDKLDLRKTNLFERDSISILKGNIELDIVGNTLDNVIGEALFENLEYKNEHKTFTFKDFRINSSLKDSIKTIEINSKDIVKGKLEGNFTFKDALPVFQNALGSVYSNYKALPVAPNQYLKFNFSIYNQIVDVFLPEISIGNNTKIKGRVDANRNDVKLTFSSPDVFAYDNTIKDIVFRIDNKNKLYNTHLTAKAIQNTYYNLKDLNLINRTSNDTLFFKSTFKGGKPLTDSFNLDFFFTIDKNQKSVIGMQKSSFNHNGVLWSINPQNNKNNKVTFDVSKNNFLISPFDLVSDEQKMEFEGTINGDNQKDIKVNFTNVELLGILPQSETLSLSGLLNGTVSLKENEEKIEPIASISVKDIIINDFSQGTLGMEIEGKNSLKKFKINAALRDYEYDNIKIAGDLDFSQEDAQVDLDINFREYELNGFSDFGGDVISNIRGRMTGNFTAKGKALNPAFEGEIALVESGLTFPYLNIDFDFIDNTTIKLLDQSFYIDNMVMEDTKFDTQGKLSGSITHQDFETWDLNLTVDSENLLVLDTKEAEEVPYYGKGLINGNAQIRGLTSNLSIDVNARTQSGTLFVIPLNDVSTINNYKLIRFKSPDQDTDSENINLEKVKGLNLNFNLTVTKDAVAQVVIDKVSGSDLKGSGNGNLNIEIDTRGKFIMDGGISIDKGVYNFKYGGIISKPFNVQKGGTISWTGDPLNAQLDLTAIYQTKANPVQLLDNINSTRKIPIDLYTKITGGLFDSKQEFDIKIPNANSTVASELEFKLNENDVNTKMQHFTFLLAFGTFYDEEAIGSSASQGITGTAAQVATSVLSSVINKEDGKFRVGLGYIQGDRTNIDELQNTIDDQVDVSVSTQISDRVLVNGRVGVPVGGNTQTSVVGEVKVEVLLNEDGSLRGTFFNKPNDVQFDIDNEGYTQGLGLSYQVNFNTISELGKKIGIKKKKKEKRIAKKDSIIVQRKKILSFKTKPDSIKNLK